MTLGTMWNAEAKGCHRMKTAFKPLRPFLGLIIVVLGLGVCVPVAAWLAFSPPMDYVVGAEFRELPADDKELQQWLLSQPDVYIGFVQREGNKLTAVWGHARNGFRDPVTPNLRQQFEKFGYKELTTYHEEKCFRDK